MHIICPLCYHRGLRLKRPVWLQLNFRVLGNISWTTEGNHFIFSVLTYHGRVAWLVKCQGQWSKSRSLAAPISHILFSFLSLCLLNLVAFTFLENIFLVICRSSWWRVRIPSLYSLKKKLEPDRQDKVSRNKLNVFDFDSSESDETENGDRDHLHAKDYTNTEPAVSKSLVPDYEDRSPGNKFSDNDIGMESPVSSK